MLNEEVDMVEIVDYMLQKGKKAKVTPIIISGPYDYHKTKKVWEKFKIFLKDHDIIYYQINAINGSILTKLLHLIYLSDYASIYFSILTKTDHSPVEPIKYFK